MAMNFYGNFLWQNLLWQLFFYVDETIFSPGGHHLDYLAGGNLRMSIHRGDTIGECLAPRISPPEIVQEYKRIEDEI